MRKRKIGAIAMISLAIGSGFGAANRASAQDVTGRYQQMAPLDQYLMANQAAEISLARSAAPASISGDAEVLVLGPHGFERAVKGTNGFVCLVARSWTSAPDADFWDPRVRVPMCFNPAAARSYLQNYFKKTELVLAGRTKSQTLEAVVAAVDQDQLPAMEPGAMCYMLSKDGFGGDSAPHWPPHLMFFYPQTNISAWGANLPGSPVAGYEDRGEHLTSYVVVVRKWSDGTDGFATPSHTSAPTTAGGHMHP